MVSETLAVTICFGHITKFFHGLVSQLFCFVLLHFCVGCFENYPTPAAGDRGGLLLTQLRPVELSSVLYTAAAPPAALAVALSASLSRIIQPIIYHSQTTPKNIQKLKFTKLNFPPEYFLFQNLIQPKKVFSLLLLLLLSVYNGCQSLFSHVAVVVVV